MTRVIVAGPDPHDLAGALEAEGASVARVGSPVFGDDLTDAGVADADLFVLTDAAEAMSLPIAREANPDVRLVAYVDDSLPESVSGVVDLAVDPSLLDPDAVAEELLRT